MRIFTSKIKGDRVVLDGDSHRHVAYALRSKVGDRITLCPQDGCDYSGVIEKITSDKTTVKIVEKFRSLGEPNIELTVYFAIPHKSEKIDLIVQKLTELGVVRMQPIVSKFAQVGAKSVKEDRLARICEEAAKQCGRGVIPKVSTTISFDDMCEELGGYDLAIFAYENEKTVSLKSVLRSSRSLKTVAAIVGSEGGFAPEEASKAAEFGARCVSLGSRILRAETANMALAAAIMYELDEWQIKSEEKGV